MRKDEKEKQVESLRQELQRARTVLFSGFEGITVAQDNELRRKVAQAGGKYRVVKNSLIERAAPGTPSSPIAEKLRGTTSLAYTEADPVGLAKALTAYAKENPVLAFKAGVVEGRVIDLSELTVIASLPSRDVLLSKALFLFNSPAHRLASAVSGIARKIAFLIQQGVKEKRFSD